jgi:hypothetical protein
VTTTEALRAACEYGGIPLPSTPEGKALARAAYLGGGPVEIPAVSSVNWWRGGSEGHYLTMAGLRVARIVAALARVEAQPPPKPGGPEVLPVALDALARLEQNKATVALAHDLAARAQAGREKYGDVLRAHNGRDAGRDAYEEAQDLYMYATQRVMETPPEAPASRGVAHRTAAREALARAVAEAALLYGGDDGI